MAKVGINYKGLHKRDTYEGLIDYLENKQEKIKFPNREAKFVRDSPQYQSLLNEGFVEVEEQQLKQVKEEQKEHAVIQTANDTNETAKEVKVVASQTDKPLIVKTKSQATQSTHSQASPQIFDMTLNDHMSNFKQDVESVENTQQQNKQQQAQHINRILQHHLQHEATPDTENFAHKIASSASSAASAMQNFGQGLRHLSSSTKQPNTKYSTSLLLGDDLPNTKPYLLFGEMNPPQLAVGEKLPHQKKSRPKDKKIFDIDDAIEKSKPKAKAKTDPLKVQPMEIDGELEDIESKPKPKPPPKPKPKNKDKDKDKDKDVPPVIKTPKLKTKNVSGLTTGVQIPPSKIGIQKLREELENAKNKNKLTAQDTSDYMKLYDDWKGAKGDKAKKDEKLKGLREIYKRVLYKKG